MANIDDVLAQELPPPTPEPYVENERRTVNNVRVPVPVGLKPFPPGVSGNPSGRPSNYTVTRALREGLTIKEAKRIAAAAIELAADGSIRHMEYVRDSLEGKPGVRIAEGEWNPETAPTFGIMDAYRKLLAPAEESPEHSAQSTEPDADSTA